MQSEKKLDRFYDELFIETARLGVGFSKVVWRDKQSTIPNFVPAICVTLKSKVNSLSAYLVRRD